MLKKWILRLLAGVLVIVFALLLTAPANVIENQITSNVPGVQISGTTGGLWSGNFNQVSYRGVSLQQVSWQLSKFSFLTGKLGAEISIDDLLFNGSFSFKQGLSQNLSLSDVNAEQSVQALAALWIPFKMIDPEGDLIWNNAALSIEGKKFVQADGEIHWQNAALNINNQHLALGTIILSLGTDNNDLLITLSDDKSVLDLQGTLRFSSDGKYHLQANVQENLPSNLSNAMQFLARPDGSGRLSFSIPGRL